MNNPTQTHFATALLRDVNQAIMYKARGKLATELTGAFFACSPFASGRARLSPCFYREDR